MSSGMLSRLSWLLGGALVAAGADGVTCVEAPAGAEVSAGAGRSVGAGGAGAGSAGGECSTNTRGFALPGVLACKDDPDGADGSTGTWPVADGPAGAESLAGEEADDLACCSLASRFRWSRSRSTLVFKVSSRPAFWYLSARRAKVVLFFLKRSCQD